jgi:flavodoxin
MKILIIFGSLLGKTKRLAVLAGTELKKKGFTVTVEDVIDAQIYELKNHDLIILACSTWDDGILQYDFRAFNDKLLKANLKGIKFAVIGLGGHKYKHFCASVDILENTVTTAKGELSVPSLRLDLDHDEPIDKCDNELLAWLSTISTE